MEYNSETGDPILRWDDESVNYSPSKIMERDNVDYDTSLTILREEHRIKYLRNKYQSNNKHYNRSNY